LPKFLKCQQLGRESFSPTVSFVWQSAPADRVQPATNCRRAKEVRCNMLFLLVFYKWHGFRIAFCDIE